jgi:hypothetical protein
MIPHSKYTQQGAWRNVCLTNIFHVHIFTSSSPGLRNTAALMKLLLIVVLISLPGCKTESKRIVHFSELGWSFELPPGISFHDSSFNNNGEINKSRWDTSLDSKKRIELFWIKPVKKNYFNAIVYIDSSDLQKWSNDIRSDSRFYIGLAYQTPQFKVLDTLIATENLGGASLQKEYMKIYNIVTSDTTYSYKFSRKYKNYSIFMNIRYTDKTIGNHLMTIFRSSKFDK